MPIGDAMTIQEQLRRKATLRNLTNGQETVMHGPDAPLDCQAADYIDQLEAEVRRLKSPAMEEYRKRFEKDFPDGL